MSLLLLFRARNSAQLTVKIYDGDGVTLIRSQTVNPTAIANYDIALTTLERAAITTWPIQVWVTNDTGQIDIEDVEGLVPTIPSTLVWVKVGGVWKAATMYVKVSGVWKSTTPKVRASSWK